jgi:hypothetical protein
MGHCRRQPSAGLAHPAYATIKEGEMALPEKRDELNRIDETCVVPLNQAAAVDSRIEEHQVIENREAEQREVEERHRHGHEFGRDIHPERFPRESLSRLEEGILEDDELRHSHDHLSFAGPDLEARVDDSRNLSRTLIVLGMFLLIFAWVLLLWVGWDVRSGSDFFGAMCALSIAVGLGLVVWGFVERQRVLRLHSRVVARPEGEIQRVGTERRLGESDRAA